MKTTKTKSAFKDVMSLISKFNAIKDGIINKEYTIDDALQHLKDVGFQESFITGVREQLTNLSISDFKKVLNNK